MNRRAWLSAVAAACVCASALAQDAPAFTRGEIERIASHGPWPMRWQPDPSNRVSGNRAAAQFGERLFFDARLSSTGSVACATCHIPERRFTDGRKLAVGLAELDRHTPSLIDVRLNRWFGWDGMGDSLWAQSIRPLLDGREMNLREEDVAQRVRADPELACRYRAAFGAAPPADDTKLLVDVAKALAAFQETLASGRSPFDDFRDALVRGDRAAVQRYPAAAQRGARIFIGAGQCSLCHFGPNFANGEFDEIGIPHYTKGGGIDWGRAQGINMLLASRFSKLSGHSDDATGASAQSTRHVKLAWRNYGEFKIPSLRNVALTAPYMHNGSLATLREVVRHYSELDLTRLHLGPNLYDADGAVIDPGIPTMLKPLNLSEREIDDLVAFLETLSEKSPRPWQPVSAAPCR